MGPVWRNFSTSALALKQRHKTVEMTRQAQNTIEFTDRDLASSSPREKTGFAVQIRGTRKAPKRTSMSLEREVQAY